MKRQCCLVVCCLMGGCAQPDTFQLQQLVLDRDSPVQRMSTIIYGDRRCSIDKRRIDWADIEHCVKAKKLSQNLQVSAESIDLGEDGILEAMGTSIQLRANRLIVGEIMTHGGNLHICSQHIEMKRMDTHVPRQSCHPFTQKDLPPGASHDGDTVNLSRLGRFGWLTLEGAECTNWSELSVDIVLAPQGQWSAVYREDVGCGVQVHVDRFAYHQAQPHYKGRVDTQARSGGDVWVYTSSPLPSDLVIDTRGSGQVEACPGRALFGSRQPQMVLSVQVPRVIVDLSSATWVRSITLVEGVKSGLLNIVPDVFQTLQRRLELEIHPRFLRGEDYRSSKGHGFEEDGRRFVALYSENAWQRVCNE